MDIQSIEINCDGCRGSIDLNNECYCESCMDAKQAEFEETETIISKLEKQIDELNEEIKQLRIGIQTG